MKCSLWWHADVGETCSGVDSWRPGTSSGVESCH